MTNKQAIIRYVGYIVSTIPLAIGFIMVGFRKDRRALHDLLAETVVIYK
ncbi:MAG: RDD family protein [Thiovulaceae bacterium]|nr:RDD family protein [Sulfurimonadaceae bacterium]